MAYKREQIEKLFKSSFNMSTWKDIIINFFHSTEVYAEPRPIEMDSQEAEGYELAYLDTNDSYRIGFFYLKLDHSIDNRKVGLRQMIAKYIKIDADAGIGVFDDGNHWRLSFITDLRGEKTSPKRYTFVFGKSENGYRTAVDRFMDLQSKGISFANIKEAFSVEALTKQFYNDLFDWYTWALDEKSGVYFPENKSMTEDEKKNAPATRMIRLITRLMFVWFIKQKGLVPDALFNSEEVGHWLKDFDPQSPDQYNYYQAILQNLFFATLNRPIKTPIYDKDDNKVGEERRAFAHVQGKHDVKSLYRYQELFKISEDTILSIFDFVPFINGGLFECLDKDKTQDGVDAYWEDGFTRNKTKDSTGRYVNRACIPNKLFFDPEDGIISIFNRYNFTVEENSPSEQQVALDPELLGKVFENLLGVYNPETHDTARSQSGSFYTPREIVNYMVDRSLEAYLGNTDDVKTLFRDDFVYDENKREFYDDVIKKLKSIKVLDPACGSGAFPMGMLNRIVEIMQNLNAPGNKYDQKLEIMENCIYGGDIQTIAAQITKLRFFISLVCDCKVEPNNPDANYGIPDLPNLETHFVTCDSLIGLKKPQQQSLFEQDVIALKEKLKEVRHKHFTAKTVYQKTKLRDRDKELRDELTRMLSDDNVIASEDAKQMAAWNPYDQNGTSPFFDPEWMFGIKDGFDVVIGNPPYIEAKKLKGIADKLKGYSVYSGTADYSIYFIEKGLKLCNSNGALYYITTNKFFNTGYGEKLKKFILKKNITHLINFEQVEVFEKVLVSSVVLGIKNLPAIEGNNIAFKQYKKLKNKDFKKLFTGILTAEDVYPQDVLDEKEWAFANATHLVLKKKIETYIQNGHTLTRSHLADVKGVSIYRGVTTGYNPAFIITDEQRDDLISQDPNNADIIKNLLQGRNVRKWYYDESDENLVFIPWHFPLHNEDISGASDKAEATFQIKYPSLYKHFMAHREELSARNQDETGIRYEWYALQRCAASYYPEFDRNEKIIWGLTADKWAYTLDEGKHYLPSNGYILTSSDIPVRYILGLLNSDLLKYYFTFIGVMTAGGAFTLKAKTISSLPFAKADDMKPVIDIVNVILQKKADNHDADITIEEEKLNNLVYKIYNIDESEQKLIKEKLASF